MKRVLTLAAVALFTLSMTSCEKCIECTYDFGGASVVAPEICGKKKDVKEAQDILESNSLYTGVTCKDV